MEKRIECPGADRLSGDVKVLDWVRRPVRETLRGEATVLRVVLDHCDQSDYGICRVTKTRCPFAPEVRGADCD